jgi:hypothetical protein
MPQGLDGEGLTSRCRADAARSMRSVDERSSEGLMQFRLLCHIARQFGG